MGERVYGAVSGVDFPSDGRQRMLKQKARLTSNDSGPVHGVDSPLRFAGVPVASFAKLELGCPVRCTRR
jgi:hypothetical protein